MLKRNKLLFLILLFAIALRFIGIYPGFSQYHPDEGMSYGQGITMLRQNSLDVHGYALPLSYPSLIPIINAVLFKVLFIPVAWLKFIATHVPQLADGLIRFPLNKDEYGRIFQLEILGEREINVMTWGRLIAAAFGVGVVFMSYLVSKKMFGKIAGLTIGVLVAVNYRQVLNSHLDLPDIYNAFFLLLSIYFSLNLLAEKSRRNYLLAGIFVGLSLTTKFHTYAVYPFLVVHLLLAAKYLYGNKDFSFREVLKEIVSSNVFLAGMIALLIVLVVNPYHLIRIEETIATLDYVAKKYAVGRNEFSPYTLWYLYTIGIGRTTSVLVVVGGLFSLIKKPKYALILLSAIIPFFYVVTYKTIGSFYTRNFVTITPLLLIFAGFVVSQIWESKKLIFRILFVVLFGLAVFENLANSVVVASEYRKPWNYQVTTDWLFKNIKPGTKVAAHPFDPPTGSPEIIKTEFTVNGAYSLQEHQENGAEYALVNLDWAGDQFYFWMTQGVKDWTGGWAGKPLNIMRNTYSGLAVEQFFRYQVFSVTKPSQAPDSNLVLAKLIPWPKVNYKVVDKFNFDSDSQNWRVLGNFSKSVISEIYNSDKQALVLTDKGNRYGTTRLASAAIKIEPKHLYKVTADLAINKQLIPLERDGFLRIDFYETQNDLENVGITSSVSSRVYGNLGWMSKQIIDRAPDTANYMVVSVGVGNPQLEVSVDNVVIEESIEIQENLLDSAPFIKKQIDLDLLYPNSHGNL